MQEVLRAFFLFPLVFIFTFLFSSRGYNDAESLCVKCINTLTLHLTAFIKHSREKEKKRIACVRNYGDAFKRVWHIDASPTHITHKQRQVKNIQSRIFSCGSRTWKKTATEKTPHETWTSYVRTLAHTTYWVFIYVIRKMLEECKPMEK